MGSVTFRDGIDFTVPTGKTYSWGADSVNTFGTLTVKGTLQLGGNIRGGTVTSTSLCPTGREGIGITINATTVDVQSGATLTATGLGFNRHTGPGHYNNDRGATHAGIGGQNWYRDPYGSKTAPTSFGSGGASNSGYQSFGGGAFKIVATDTVTINGTVSANGYGSTSNANYRGGGAGGSIWISATNTITGSGNVTANGAGGYYYGGGGGRIRLDTADISGFLGAVQAGRGYGRERYGSFGSVTFRNGTNLTIPVGKTYRWGADSVNTFGTFTVKGTLQLGGNIRGGTSTSTSLCPTGKEGIGVTINAATVDVQSGATVTASSLGFGRHTGPGYYNNNCAATHGGKGGSSPRATYGSNTEPTALGSGGPSNAGYYSDGGGAFKINATGTVTVDGTLVANAYSNTGNSNYRGGGAGGSIWIIANAWAGSGTVQAHGGGGYYWGGGGGRIAVYANSRSFHGDIDLDLLDNSGYVTVTGGSGRNVNGAVGTIYYYIAGISQLAFVDGYQTEIIVEEASNAFQIEIQDSDGNAAAPLYDITIDLTEQNYGESGVTFYSDAACTTPITELTIEAGETLTDEFYIKYTGTTIPASLILDAASSGLTSAETDPITAKSAFSGFTVVPEDDIYTRIAGSTFSLIITAIDDEGAAATSYAGPANISITAQLPTTGLGAFSHTTTSASTFTEGVCTITGVNYSDCGYITITIIDTEDASITGTSNVFTFIPKDFLVEVDETENVVGDTFNTTVTTRNYNNAVCQYYTGPATLSINTYVTPSEDQEGTVTPTNLTASYWINGIAEIEECTYDKWGSITLKCEDDVLETVTGETGEIKFIPKDFLIEITDAPADREFFYLNETFEITITVRDHEGAVIPNYAGEVTFSGSSFTLPDDYTYDPGEDEGIKKFYLQGSREDIAQFTVEDTEYTDTKTTSDDVEIKEGKIVVGSKYAPIGKTAVSVKIVDLGGATLISDNSTIFTLRVSEEYENNSCKVNGISYSDGGELMVTNGTAIIYVENDEAEIVTLTPSAEPSMRSESGEITFGGMKNRIIVQERWRIKR